MGKSRSNTGIKIIDEAVDFSANTAAQGAKNVERSVGSMLTETAYAVGTGDFNNYGNTLLAAGAGIATGGYSLAAGYKPGETGTQRKAREEGAKASAQAVADKKAAENAATAQRAGTLRGIIEGRNRAPGRSATLLSSSGAGTLLTPKG